jgi:hypothetical protein
MIKIISELVLKTILEVTKFAINIQKLFRKKDVSTIKNGSESLRIFEGFFDFLSFKNIEKFEKKAF